MTYAIPAPLDTRLELSITPKRDRLTRTLTLEDTTFCMERNRALIDLVTAKRSAGVEIEEGTGGSIRSDQSFRMIDPYFHFRCKGRDQGARSTSSDF